jgi:hypothetical protein
MSLSENLPDEKKKTVIYENYLKRRQKGQTSVLTAKRQKKEPVF